jgi:hypothetical protein
MWQNPEADATVLNAMIISRYGEQALDWDPLTIRLEIQEDFRVEPVDEVMNKICAMQIVMTSSDFFERIDTFINVCNALADGDPFFEVFTPLEPEEIAFAISTVAMNRDMLPFNPTIQRYVKEVLKSEGFDEENFPEIFSAIFGKQSSAKDIRHTVAGVILEPTAADSNSQNITDMIVKNVGIMLRQFNELPGLTEVDSFVLEQGLLSALGTAIEKDRSKDNITSDET